MQFLKCVILKHNNLFIFPLMTELLNVWLYVYCQITVTYLINVILLTYFSDMYFLNS